MISRPPMPVDIECLINTAITSVSLYFLKLTIYLHWTRPFDWSMLTFIPIDVLGIITPSGEHAHARGRYAFDRSINTYWDGRSTKAWIVYNAGRRRVALSYKIATKHFGCPRQWEFQGGNSFNDYEVIDTQANGICHRARFAHYDLIGKLQVSLVQPLCSKHALE